MLEEHDGVTAPKSPPRTALVLSGGGARGAYQVGILRGLADLGLVRQGRSSFDVLVGSSAGAINAAALAAYADAMEEGIDRLEHVWGEMEPRHVFRTDLWSLGNIGMQWVRDLTFGGALRHVAPKALLDTAPLWELLDRSVPLGRIDDQLKRGAFDAIAVPATDLSTSSGAVFLQAVPEAPVWERSRWHVERTRLTVAHLMASSAIPIFFPAVEIDGRHFVDGSVRNTAPLRPAISLGAERIIAVGVRGPNRVLPTTGRAAPRTAPTVAQIAGVLLDAVLLDAIETDVEHAARVNTSVLQCGTDDPRNPFRLVDVLWLHPSRSLAAIAAELADRIPAVVRYLLRGLGDDESTTELASYLLFDAAYCRKLMEVGREDVANRAEEIRQFFWARRDA